MFGIGYALDVRVAFVYYAPVCSHFDFLWLVNVSLCVCIFGQIQFFQIPWIRKKANLLVDSCWHQGMSLYFWIWDAQLPFSNPMGRCLGWEIGWTVLLAAHILEWLPVFVVLLVICPDRMIYLDLESLEVPVPHVQLQVYSWVSVVCRVLLCHQWEECESQQCLGMIVWQNAHWEVLLCPGRQSVMSRLVQSKEVLLGRGCSIMIELQNWVVFVRAMSVLQEGSHFVFSVRVSEIFGNVRNFISLVSPSLPVVVSFFLLGPFKKSVSFAYFSFQLWGHPRFVVVSSAYSFCG